MAWAPIPRRNLGRGDRRYPDSLSEYQFAGLLRGSKTRSRVRLRMICKCPRRRRSCSRVTSIPARLRSRGPFGDHKGYNNEQDRFPVFTIERITMRRDPIYHSTYTGKPRTSRGAGCCAERSIRAAAHQAVSEIVDFLSAAGRLLVPHRVA